MPIDVQWRSPAACIDAASVPSRVATLVGDTLLQPLVVELSAAQLDRRWRISIELPNSTSRTVEGPDCATLTDAVALIVAVHADAIAVAERVAPSASVPAPAIEEDPTTVDDTPRATPTTPVDRRPTSSSPAPVVASPTASPRTRARAQLGAAVMAELGAMPRNAATFELTAGVSWPHVFVGIGGLSSVGPDARSDDLPGIGARFRLYSGLVRACAVLPRERFELPVCGTVEVGDLRASGTGLTEPNTLDVVWIAATIGARPRLRLGERFALGLTPEVVVPLRRHRFSVGDGVLVHELPTVAARVGVQLVVRLP